MSACCRKLPHPDTLMTLRRLMLDVMIGAGT